MFLNPNDEAIVREGMDALVARLGLGGTFRFLAIQSNGTGDHLETPPDGPTVDDLVADILNRHEIQERQRRIS